MMVQENRNQTFIDIFSETYHFLHSGMLNNKNLKIFYSHYKKCVQGEKSTKGSGTFKKPLM